MITETLIKVSERPAMSNPGFLSKLLESRYSGFLLVAFVIGLYILQTKVISPFVETVASSNVFQEEAVLDGKDLSQMAALHCNHFVQDRLGASDTIEFMDGGHRVWQLSNGRYLVSSHVVERDASGRRKNIAFACNIHYTGGVEGDDTLQSNWSLEGLELNQT
ncbi:hypothetical protein ACR2R6_01085 [Methylocaldum gracile subsp. desertum]|uniref:hypothetical protein n=1 Tax=Methylocaldum sp. GT1BW TaxID=3438964 RepID=UPI003DA0C642